MVQDPNVDPLQQRFQDALRMLADEFKAAGNDPEALAKARAHLDSLFQVEGVVIAPEGRDLWAKAFAGSESLMAQLLGPSSEEGGSTSYTANVGPQGVDVFRIPGDPLPPGGPVRSVGPAEGAGRTSPAEEEEEGGDGPDAD